MSAALEFLPEAVLEVEEATRFYEERVPGLGGGFRSELMSACNAVTREPLLWRKRPGGFRHVNLPSFLFYVAYFIRGERILVAAVGHVSRHPNYWQQRQ